jgi:hypothetical protein
LKIELNRLSHLKEANVKKLLPKTFLGIRGTLILFLTQISPHGPQFDNEDLYAERQDILYPV